MPGKAATTRKKPASKSASDVLVKRRLSRGRPSTAETQSSKPMTVVDVFIARDPQGVKIFKSQPKLSLVGTWTGAMLKGYDVMDPKNFVLKFRNAVLPGRGKCVTAKLGS